MNKSEMIERSRKALAEFARLPPAEQVQELVASGTINERGEVIGMTHIAYDDASLGPKAKAWLQKHEGIFRGSLPAGKFVWKAQVNQIRLMQQVGGMNGEVDRCGFYSSAIDRDPFDTILRQIALEFPRHDPPNGQ